MPEEGADIVGTTDSNFTIFIDSATIVNAVLRVPNKPNVTLRVLGQREVEIPKLPAGDSRVRLDLVWAPGDPDATVDVGRVISGSASAPEPKRTIPHGDTPGYVKLFGK